MNMKVRLRKNYVTQSILMYTTTKRDRQWLLSSTVESNEFPLLELLGNWEPLDSSCAWRLCQALESQTSLPLGD